MCKAFSCLVLPDKKVIWKFRVDSHSDLQLEAKLADSTTDPYEDILTTPYLGREREESYARQQHGTNDKV